LSFRQAPLDDEVLSLPIAELAHALQEAVVNGLQGDRSSPEKSDAPHPVSLLRARRKRPRCCAAKQRDELAPFHGLPSSGREPHITIPLRENAAMQCGKIARRMAEMGSIATGAT